MTKTRVQAGKSQSSLQSCLFSKGFFTSLLNFILLACNRIRSVYLLVGGLKMSPSSRYFSLSVFSFFFFRPRVVSCGRPEPKASSGLVCSRASHQVLAPPSCQCGADSKKTKRASAKVQKVWACRWLPRPEQRILLVCNVCRLLFEAPQVSTHPRRCLCFLHLLSEETSVFSYIFSFHALSTIIILFFCSFFPHLEVNELQNRSSFLESLCSAVCLQR